MSLQVLGAIFNVLVALVFPLGVLVYLLVRRRRLVLPFLAGTLTFTLSQVLIRVPLLNFLRGTAWFTAFTFQTVPYALFLGLTAGLFEETGRLIAMTLMRRHQGYGDAVAFGLGHGGVEAVLTVGVNNAALLLFYGGLLALQPAWLVPLAGLERAFAMMAHVGYSVLVMRTVQTRRPWHFVAAVLLHAALDTVVVLIAPVLGAIATEVFIALFGLGMLVYTIRSRPKPAALSETPNQPLEPTIKPTEETEL